ncbi:MAG: nodulation protein NfeD [Deltaproteobacteria bacterium]|nr:nodulation protein NfeD [Deltaproteobacteria bacterium]MBW1925266.1 nodulation protein NfeD [Deltaproteobacteria bacterium]MBW1951128.1 nodulation protein NfeD [Deltaproteobacteria bacterium]MBW2009694.1 nodulation protein NfeD [Deltaproteobacteria bacterium]MBW2347582.1 nodulation protein NfeD [Deltaproteobacteria bacterium]
MGGRCAVERLALFFLGLILLGTWASTLDAQEGPVRHALIIELEGPISPASAMFVNRGLEEAAQKDAALVVLRMDTPGGLASSMRTIVKAILNSPVPVAVYVGPEGAGAASAGVMVTVAGHVAAMAPGTNIGAAHPVTAGGKDIEKTMSEKVVNDMASYGRGIAENKGRNGEWVEKAIRESVSITADEAVDLHVVDLIATDLDDLFQKLDGKEVEVAGGTVTLATKGLVKVYYVPGFRDRILKTISDPNVAYILMMIGLAGLYFELSHPGALFPGVIGGISLILAFYSFQTLPVNYAGLLLIALAIIFFIMELKVPSYGILSVGGVVSLTLGSIMLFEDVGVSIKVMAPTILLVGGFFVVLAALAFRAYRGKPKGGMEGLIGEVGSVEEAIDPEGLVFVHGEYWRARSREKLEKGARVVVEDMDGLVLRVRKFIGDDI